MINLWYCVCLLTQQVMSVCMCVCGTCICVWSTCVCEREARVCVHVQLCNLPGGKICSFNQSCLADESDDLLKVLVLQWTWACQLTAKSCPPCRLDPEVLSQLRWSMCSLCFCTYKCFLYMVFFDLFCFVLLLFFFRGGGGVLFFFFVILLVVLGFFSLTIVEL